MFRKCNTVLPSHLLRTALQSKKERCSVTDSVRYMTNCIVALGKLMPWESSDASRLGSSNRSRRSAAWNGEVPSSSPFLLWLRPRELDLQLESHLDGLSGK